MYGLVAAAANQSEEPISGEAIEDAQKGAIAIARVGGRIGSVASIARKSCGGGKPGQVSCMGHSANEKYATPSMDL